MIWFIFISFTEQHHVKDLWARRLELCWRDRVVPDSQDRAGLINA